MGDGKTSSRTEESGEIWIGNELITGVECDFNTNWARRQAPSPCIKNLEHLATPIVGLAAERSRRQPEFYSFSLFVIPPPAA